MNLVRSMMMLLFFIIFFSTANTLQSEERLSPPVKKIWPSVVAVSTYDREGRTIRQGMGFFVSREGDVITTRDLLKGSYRVEVKTIDGMLYPVREVMNEDREAGLVRIGIEIPSGLAQPLPVNAFLPRVGERVFVLNRFVPGKPISGGIVSAISAIPAFGEIIRLNAAISPEANGGPVVNMKGEVIGVVISRTINDQTHSFVVSNEKVLKLKPGKAKPLSEWEGEQENRAQVLYTMGLDLLWEGGYKEAISYFTKATEEDPRYVLAYFQIGYCRAQLRQPREAIEAYKKAIQIKPDFIFAHFYLGLSYLEIGDRDDALEEYKSLKRLNEDYANDLHNMIY